MQSKNTSHTRQQEPKSASPGLQQKSANSSTRERVYKRTNRIVQRQLRQSYRRYMNNIFTEENVSSQTTKNKQFWSRVKHQRSSNAGIAPVKNDGRLTSDLKEQAEVLNLSFSQSLMMARGTQKKNSRKRLTCMTVTSQPWWTSRSPSEG